MQRSSVNDLCYNKGKTLKIQRGLCKEGGKCFRECDRENEGKIKLYTESKMQKKKKIEGSFFLSFFFKNEEESEEGKKERKRQGKERMET